MNNSTKQAILKLVDQARARLEEDIRKLDEIIKEITYTK